MVDTRYEVDIWTKEGQGFYQCIEAIIGNTRYEGMRGFYHYELSTEDGHTFVTLVVYRADTFTKVKSEGRNFRRELLPSMSESQIVKLLFGLGRDFDEHEGREGFTYRGRRVFGPHIDIAAMWSIAETYEQRQDGPSNWPEVDTEAENK